ncbi:UDP-N-acetylglucosamine 2-epimerase (non-hydrolyzing) [Sandarakinorhabdus sp.]|uniref:non-hydrolyzing UDP-N-acetylglucosamine 2-epimerase n=1 Tax=Sandarakinorhabdus sp. TaxID=1916663 RepID=UPI00333E81FD
MKVGLPDSPTAPILFVAGTRPEAVKLAPVILDGMARGHAPILVATGQHRDLFDAALAGFGLQADLDLGVMVPTPDQQVGQLVPMLADVIRRKRPAWVVVQGDTSSTLAGALAARYAGAPLAHIEAGLRSGSSDPHPEEMHRKLVAQMADLHFAPTAAAAAALAAEGVHSGVHVTGNSGIDALLLMQARLAADPGLAAAAAAPAAHISRDRPWIVATVHRRENQGARLGQVLAALAALADEAEVIVPVHPSPAVSGPLRAALGGISGVHLLPPLAYPAFVALMGRAALALTDSGGVQEEAPALGLPCLVLRDVTERPEGVASGNAQLVGCDTAAIVAAARMVLGDAHLRARMGQAAMPYGIGNAARLINCVLLRPAGEASAQSPESWLQSAAHHQPLQAAAR